MDYKETIESLINKLNDIISVCDDITKREKIREVITNLRDMKIQQVPLNIILDYVKVALDCIDNDKPLPKTGTDIPPRYGPKGSSNPNGGGKYQDGINKSPSQGDKKNGKNNPYGFDYDEPDEDEQIRRYIEDDIPVFIHGESGCGKSGRVKQIDPDCTIVYLASARPETLAGKSIIVDGEVKDVPPEWYVKLCKKCEAEPNKIHILFFDEITNAPPSIQGLSFNIILNKEVNGKWKLPDNCRIVAAGNDLEESLSANPVSDPLFRRFGHVYIKTNVEKWVIWASENKIHPAIIAFIVSNGLDNNPVIRTKCNGKDPCADQRKWEMASKILYKSNNPRLLVGIVGEEITNKFIEFVRKETITLEQILNGDYDHSNDKLYSDEAWNAINAVVAVDMANVEKVVEFIHLKLLQEQYSLFVKIWTAGGKDKDRVNKLKEIEMKRKLNGSSSNSYRTMDETGGYGTINENVRRTA